jgi:hypothetical protein
MANFYVKNFIFFFFSFLNSIFNTFNDLELFNQRKKEWKKERRNTFVISLILSSFISFELRSKDMSFLGIGQFNNLQLGVIQSRKSHKSGKIRIIIIIKIIK